MNEGHDLLELKRQMAMIRAENREKWIGAILDIASRVSQSLGKTQ